MLSVWRVADGKVVSFLYRLLIADVINKFCLKCLTLTLIFALNILVIRAVVSLISILLASYFDTGIALKKFPLPHLAPERLICCFREIIYASFVSVVVGVSFFSSGSLVWKYVRSSSASYLVRAIIVRIASIHSSLVRLSSVLLCSFSHISTLCFISSFRLMLIVVIFIGWTIFFLEYWLLYYQYVYRMLPSSEHFCSVARHQISCLRRLELDRLLFRSSSGI